ncbi:TonB-dependent receptor [Aurantiacibacter suaedae]|uniref:TonB-dependent receptor n=1 Tax=Aurantiacibacter suaedae TaxID=2545755 RepID=UPI001386F703|nr:TonB-dependent receptor [Aurantiacibacter suaedae]
MRAITRWTSGLSMLTLGVALAAPVAAQDGNAAEKDIIVTGARIPVLSEESPTGSRLGLSILETPATVNVVSGDDIRARGDAGIVDAVSRAAGVTNAGNPGNGGLTFAVRGFSGQGSVLQLYDGVRLYPNNGSITFPSDPWNVERIDVLSGPASLLFGQGALGGVVNVIPKSPNRERFELQAEAGYGSQETWHMAAGTGGPLGDMFAFRVDASYRQSNGYVDRGESDNLALSTALEFAPSDTFSLTLRNDFGDANPMKYFGTPLIDGRLDTSIREENYNVGDAKMHYRDNRTALKLDWQVSDAVSVTNTAYYITSNRKWRNLESYADAGNGLIARADNYGIAHDVDQYGSQGNVTLSSEFGGGMSNDVLVGYDVNYFKLNYSHQFGSLPQQDEVPRIGFAPGRFLDTVGLLPRYHTDTFTWAIYAEDRLALTDQIALIGAIRHEENKVGRWNWDYTDGRITGDTPALNGGADAHKTFTATTWRVGAVYQPVENVSLYAQYATAVDPLGTLTTYSDKASQFELSFADGYQYEAGVKGLFMGGKGSFTLAGYRLVKKNLFTQEVTNGPIEQVGQRSSQGIEATIDVALPAGFGFSANGTVLDANFDEFGGNEGNTPSDIPEEAANVELRWSDGAAISARANLRYVGSRWGDNANTVKIPSYTVVDFGASYAFSDNVALDLRLLNAFDEDYAWSTYGPEQWILGRPRSVDVTLRAGF